ncbi:hypothetical protein COO91_01132 [Nostoc flagelliforme CCNUN1]|uniref:Uncharacterized protein n=1 Tax=Nostoc flagelliforme CCNUN1 TaxID=2038116 RepID=A0A2K8SIF8_9NOSO|nr:hypothetical protein [Nostoc flagelliforme]AUB35256.1 hypothetical protein COO91_01132 [Nostoc flagelliforme CCNUN1]
MSHQDTIQTQPSLTTTEIMTIILGCEQTLRFVQASPNYQQIEASEKFSTSNDFWTLDKKTGSRIGVNIA